MYTDMIGRRDPKSTDGVTSDDDEVENCNGWDGILRRVVIGVPANCSEKKRDATRRAAHSAGFSEVRWGAFISFSHRVQLYDIIPSFLSLLCLSHPPLVLRHTASFVVLFCIFCPYYLCP